MTSEQKGPPGYEGFDRDEYTIDGVRTVVYSAGEGPPLVYWHGGGTFPGIDFARALVDRFRVIAPFHPGYGESGDAPDHFTTVRDYLPHYVALFRELGLEQFDLAGISMGGWMAAEFAAAYPDRVRKLVLLAPAGLEVPEYPAADLASIPPEDVLSWLATNVGIFQRYLPGPDRAAAFAADREREARTSMQILPPGLADPDLAGRLGRVRAPTLVLWGKQDRVLPWGQGGRWMTLLPDCRLELIDDAGHVLLDESPAARESVAQFLS